MSYIMSRATLENSKYRAKTKIYVFELFILLMPWQNRLLWRDLPFVSFDRLPTFLNPFYLLISVTAFPRLVAID